MVQFCPVLKTQLEAQSPPNLPGHCGELICEQRDLQHELGNDRVLIKALRAITTGWDSQVSSGEKEP